MKFSTGTIISAATGKLVCQIDQVYEILNFLLNENLFTHQLPRAGRFVRPFLETHCPWLMDLNTDECNTENWKEWLAKMEAEHGSEHELSPLPESAGWEQKNPITELTEMVDSKKVIVVET